MNKKTISFVSAALISLIFIITYSSAAQPSYRFGYTDLVFTNIGYRLTLINTTIISPNNSINYWNVRVVAIIKNNGTMSAVNSTSSNVISRIGSNSGYGQIIATPPLLARESAKISWNFTGYTGQYFTGVRADVLRNVTESNETNNFISTNITLP